MKLGDRIKYLRAKRHWTQFELASKANLTRSHISQLENNMITNPGVAAIRNLAKAFEVSEVTLMEAGQADLLATIFLKSDGESAVENPLSMAASTIFDPELLEWLNPQILNRLNPYTIRAIVTIIRDAMEQMNQTETQGQISTTFSLNDQTEIYDPSEFPTSNLKNHIARNNSSFRGPGGFARVI